MLTYKNYSEKKQLLLKGELSLPDNVSWFVQQIELKAKLNAFNSVFIESALMQAKIIDQKIKSGNFGKLAGMVVAVKDVLHLKNERTTCSSKILENFNSIYTATAVQKLIDEDAIIIGKTNCDEFAMGSSNENSAFGPVLNPVDTERVPGGSSGGSAAAVAAELSDAALGTDTGGSIRQPAAFCGVVGLKPTYGRVSRFGLTAFASSFDSIGPITRNIFDAALILEVISGKDENDSTSSNLSVPKFSASYKTKSKIKIGIPKEYFGIGLSNEIHQKIDLQISRLKQNGFDIIDISLPHTEYTIAAYYLLTTAEASSNLARYDGTRFGFRNPDYDSLLAMYKATRSNGFGEEVKRRIMLGTYVLSAGYYDAYYRKAQKVRRLIKEDFDSAFSKVDVILSPTTPTTAFKLGEKSDDPLQMYLSDIYTTSVNLAGLPAISIPVGNDSNNLPIGLQIIANQFNEEKLFQISEFILNED